MKTNIFDLIGIYWQCQKHFGLSNGAASLYFYLLYKMNDARWPDTLGISSLEIGGVLGISKPTLLKFKDELSSTGLIECQFVTGKIRQNYSLRNPKLMFDGVSFDRDSKVDSKEHSKVDSKQHSKDSLPSYIYKTNTKDKDSNPIVPEGTRVRQSHANAEKIYQAYPRKVAKPTALRAIQKQITKYGYDDVLSKTEQFARSVQGEDLKFIPHPATFYNQERFNDAPDTWNHSASNSGAPVKKGVSDAQKLMIMQDQQKQLKQEMQTYRNRHLSQCAMTSVWDQGSKPKYDEMASMMKKLKEKINELL